MSFVEILEKTAVLSRDGIVLASFRVLLYTIKVSEGAHIAKMQSCWFDPSSVALVMIRLDDE